MRKADRFWDFIFPSNIYCICCGSIIDHTRPYALCDSCVEKFHWVGKKTCEKCGKILDNESVHTLCFDCREIDHLFIKGYTCAGYGLYERIMMMDYKYHDRAWIGRKIGDILADRMQHIAFHPDLVVPVPIHRAREQKRGYNQAALMAGRFASRMQLKFDDKVLIRSKNTVPMRNLNVAERAANVGDAFEIKEDRDIAIVQKNILLVDDIFTTGSTADSCTNTLLKGGAKAVWLLTFACGSNVVPFNRLQ